MKNRITYMLIFILGITACDTVDFSYPGRQKCTGGQVFTGELSLDQAGIQLYDLDRVAIGDYTSMEIRKTFDLACNGDSVKVTFESEVIKETAEPVFVGCYIKYEDEITPLEVEWSENGANDHYTGTGKALAPKGYQDGNFLVVVEYGFLSKDNFLTEVDYLRSVFISADIKAEYYRMN